MIADSLSHDAYVRRLNRQMRKHPNYRRGMRVTKFRDGLYEWQPPADVHPENPQEIEKVRTDPDLQKVLWDSVSVVRQKHSRIGVWRRGRARLAHLLFPLSRDGRQSRLLQRRLRSLYCAIVEYWLLCGSWPPEVTSLIENHQLTDPWKPGEILRVKYTVPAIVPSGISRLQVLAEYLREGKRKFTLYADGHQETSKL